MKRIKPKRGIRIKGLRPITNHVVEYGLETVSVDYMDGVYWLDQKNAETAKYGAALSAAITARERGRVPFVMLTKDAKLVEQVMKQVEGAKQSDISLGSTIAYRIQIDALSPGKNP